MLCNSGAKLQSSTAVLRLSFCAKLKICASIAPPSQSPETLPASLKMTMNNFPDIQTERLSLMRLKNSDWEMISYLRTDENVNEFVNRSSAETKEKALEIVKRINTEFKNQNSIYWKITERNTDKMIGSICLWNF